MATKARLVTSGFKNLLEDLARVGRDVDAIAAEALEAGGEVLADGMRRRVPKDTHNLEEHIGVSEPKRDGNVVFVEVGVLDADEDTARYGNAQEYGSSSMQAQPFVRPALDEDMGKARKAMRTVFEGHLGEQP